MNIETLSVINAILVLISELDEFKDAWLAIGIRNKPKTIVTSLHDKAKYLF